MAERGRPTSPQSLPWRRGVGCLLLSAAGQVFVAQRIGMPGAWQMPQGGIDEGETPAQAALRELEEEIGTGKATILAESAGWYSYDFPPELIGKAWGGRYRGQTQKWFALRFTGADSDIDLATAHPEFNAWRWSDPAEVLAQIVPFKRALYRDVLAEFRHLLRD
jgi:putative (di)nucleoside polyphosphate hydrolase